MSLTSAPSRSPATSAPLGAQTTNGAAPNESGSWFPFGAPASGGTKKAWFPFGGSQSDLTAASKDTAEGATRSLSRMSVSDTRQMSSRRSQRSQESSQGMSEPETTPRRRSSPQPKARPLQVVENPSMFASLPAGHGANDLLPKVEPVSSAHDPSCDARAFRSLQPTTSWRAPRVPVLRHNMVKYIVNLTNEKCQFYLPAGVYTDLKMLARGGFGCVVEATRMADNRRVAIKRQPLWDPDLARVALREHHYLAFLTEQAPNKDIVLLEDTWCDKHHALYLVFEALPYNLEQLLSRSPDCDPSELSEDGRKLSPAVVMQVTRALLSAVEHMHARGIMHRDIKPRNVVLDQKGNTVKLIDFGTAASTAAARALGPVHDRPGTHTLTPGEHVTTSYYRAPESINGGLYNGYIDLWCIGCVVAEMIRGKVLFDEVQFPLDEQHRRLGVGSDVDMRAALRRKCPTATPLEFELMLGLLCPDVSRRLSATQALKLLSSGDLFEPLDSPAHGRKQFPTGAVWSDDEDDEPSQEEIHDDVIHPLNTSHARSDASEEYQNQ